MKKSLPWILLGVSVVLNAFFVVGYVHSQIQHARIHSERGARALMVDRLGLTEEQRTMMREARRATVEEAKRIYAEGDAARDAFWAELSKPSPDPAVLDSLTGQAAANSVALSKALTARLLAVLGHLEPEQRETLIDILERRPLLAGRYLLGGGDLYGSRPRFDRRRLGAVDAPLGFAQEDGPGERARRLRERG